jgi:hypothetical protein
VTPDHHRVRDFAVTEIVRTGEPLSPGRIAAATSLAAERVATIIDELERGMVFVFRTDGVNVDWAYPFAAAATPHRVTFGSGEPRYAAWGVDAIAAPFVQGQLTGHDIEAIVDTECAHCSAPMRMELTSALRYRVLTADAEPVISLPIVNLQGLKDPSIIHAFWNRSLFFWSEEHVNDYRQNGRIAYPTLEQVAGFTDATQSAIFGFPHTHGEPGRWCVLGTEKRTIQIRMVRF